MQIPDGHYLFGTVKVGERGQIVIPKEAREVFHIQPGDTAVTKADVLEAHAKHVFDLMNGGDRHDP